MIRGENISEFLTMAQNLDLPIDVRIECNRTFVKCTADVQGSRIKAFIWIRQHVEQETCRQILNDVDSSSTCKEEMVRWTKAKVTSRCCKTQSQRGPSWSRIFTRTRITAAFYLDFFKDSTVTVSIFYLLQGVFNMDFVSTLSWLLFSSILLPLLLSGVETAWRCPFVFLGSGGWARYTANPPSSGKLWAMRIFNVISCGIAPAVLINAKEEAKTKKEQILERVKNQFDHPVEAGAEGDLHQQLRDIDRYLEESKKTVISYKRNELSIENSIQITVQVLMLLLSPTYTSLFTHSGLQAVFQKDFAIQEKIQSGIENLSGYESSRGLSFNLTEWFLVMSILWSMKTISMTYIKIKAVGKVEMLSLPGKLLLAVRSFLVYLVRLGCVVAFFGPFLGLFNILAHWKAEQMVLDSRFKVLFGIR